MLVAGFAKGFPNGSLFSGAPLRTVAMAFSTVGKMRSTIWSTPRAFGCRPSLELQAGLAGDAVEKERIERNAVFLGQRPERWRRRRSDSRRRDWARHACRPTARQSCAAFSLPSISSRFFLAISGETPRSMSLAPSSRMTSCVPSGTDQSSRARPPLVVSPETPALATVTSWPLARRAAWSLSVKPSLGSEAEARHQAVTEADDLERLGPRRRNGAANGEENDQACGNTAFERHAAGPI